MIKGKVYFIVIIFLVTFSSCNNRSVPLADFKNNKIGIQPIGSFDQKMLEEVRDSLASTYGREVYILPEISYPEHAFVHVKSPRYRADTLIRFLKQTKPDSLDYIIGICEKDVSTTKYEEWGSKKIKQPAYKYEDWGVFGLGYVPGPSCIISTYRLKKGVSKEKLMERLRKVVKHEFGHNLGLNHCPDKNCLMTDGVESIKTVDHEKEELCTKCWNLIK